MKRLFVGYKAADLRKDLLSGDCLCHTLDIYHAHAIETVWKVPVVATPHLPEGPWDEIFFKTGPKLMSGELSLDLLQEISILLKGDLHAPRFHLDFVGKERDRNDLLNKVKDDPTRVRDFSATWPASVPGGPKILFTSFPGCFCHRRLDEGGLALAEVVCRDLAKSADGALKILDMGCGCGLVGDLIATFLRPRPCSLTLVDSHTRAIEAATVNAKALGLDEATTLLLSDNGTPKETDGTFDVFVGNPPYYSDYRIADVFLETARRALKPDGVCYSVCKNAAGLEPVQKRFFQTVEIIPRRGYSVLKSVREMGPRSHGADGSKAGGIRR